ncbi:MAG: ankyrin repeat domain-containing protein [Clostridiales bacterium]|nr:ankyrin repeat domain-containing protein [Clostridiales bacterium]
MIKKAVYGYKTRLKELKNFFLEEAGIFVACANGDIKMLEKLINKEIALGNKDCVNAVNEYGESLLGIACLQGYADIVEKLLDMGADINKGDIVNGCTPLYVACMCGYADIVEKLLKRGADPNKQSTKDGYTPLQEACLRGETKVVEKLLEGGADVNKASRIGITPIFIVDSTGNIELMKKLLLHKEIKIDGEAKSAKNKINERALIACSEGNVKELEELLDVVERVEKIGKNSLGRYFSKSDEEAKQYLINRFGIKNTLEAIPYTEKNEAIYVIENLLNKKNILCIAKGSLRKILEERILKKLIIACKESREDTVKELLDTGLDIEKALLQIDVLDENIEKILKKKLLSGKGQAAKCLKNKNREKLLSMCEAGNIEEVGKILDILGKIGAKTLGRCFSVANIEITKYLINRFSLSETVEALQYIKNDKYVVEELLNRNNILHQIRGTLETKISQRLIDACRKSDKYAVEKLLSTGIDVTKDASYMKEATDINIINMLKNHGAKEEKKRSEINKNYPKKKEKSTLIKLIRNGCKVEDVIKLLDKGVSVNEVDDEKKISALMYAIKDGNVAIAGELVKRKANLDWKDAQGKNVLMYALEKGKIMASIIDRVIDCANMDVLDNQGKDLLMYACQGGYMKAVETLVEKKNELVYNVDNRGWTAVGIAFEREDIKMTEYLFLKGATNPGEIKEKNKFYKLLGEVDTRAEKPKKTRHKTLVEKAESADKKSKTRLM